MKAVQSLLGDHHDSVIARQQERGLGMEAHLSGENAFTYGLLYEREARRPTSCAPGRSRPGRRRRALATALDELTGTVSAAAQQVTGTVA